MKLSISRFSVLALAIHSTLALADPASSSPYYTDTQSSHVADATSRGVEQVNFITCLMSAMRPDAMVNEGAYTALVDGTKCQNDAEATAGGTTTFNTAYVDVTRATNADPMISHIWLDEENEGTLSTVFVNVSATEAPSASNAYGKFRMDYCATAEGITGCLTNGYLEGSDLGMRYFEREEDNGGSPGTKAVQLNANGDSGTGKMSVDSAHEQAEFNFAYNATLFRRKDQDGDDQCFTRDASDPDTGMSVWRYGLYDATTGARINRSSGFQIEFINSGTTYRGYLGYGGLSLPSEALSVLTSGSTVQKVDYSNGDEPTRTDYTVVKSAGKLIKHTKHTRTLHDIDKVKFNVFVGSNGASLFAGAHANTSYEMYWNEADGSFKATAEMSCGMNGCNNVPVSPEQTVDVTFWSSQSGIQGFSNTLGGEVFVALNGATAVNSSADVNVVYRVQDLVYPSDMPATLHCLRDCPTAASLSAYFGLDQQSQQSSSPFETNPSQNFAPANTSIVYTTDSAAVLLKDGANAPVVFNDREAFAHSNFANGIRSGKLFTDLAATECSQGSGTYCQDKINALETYYQWEIGPNSWNQFAAVKDSNGEFLKFDAPLQVNFAVPNDAQKYGEYAGQSVVLQYGGFGELFGIPGYCVSMSTNAVVPCGDGVRYVPAFTIPYNTTQGKVTLGDTTYFVKWLDREIRFANKPSSVCDNAGLVTPTGITLPTASELKNPGDPSSSIYIGAKPVVTSAPRVIHGEVKY